MSSKQRIQQALRVMSVIILSLCAILALGYSLQYRSESVEALSKKGSTGEEVRQIQQALKNQGYYTGSVDGIYGSGTESAVRAYQKANGLSVDGIAGPSTLSSLGIGASAGSSGTTVLRNGSRGELVTEIQQRLKSWGYYNGSADGVFGSQTETAVRSFQRANGLTVDGIVGPGTYAALGVNTSGSTSGGSTSGSAAAVTATLRRGSQGSEVTTLQNRLKSLGIFTSAVDGVFGARTEAAVKTFQKNNGLTADGVVGPATRRALGYDTGASGAGSAGSSNGDYEILARLISAEARGEVYQGQVAVGAVILNRVKHPSFPDSVAGVCYQPGAFSSVDNGQINVTVAESAYRAATEVMNGVDPSGGAIYFFNPSKTSNAWLWSRPVITVIGNHRFCS